MTSGNFPNNTSNYSTEATVVFATGMTLVMLFTVVGNIMVIIAVMTYRGLRGPQYLFLVSLAVADILLAALIVPFNLANELMGYWYFEPFWCNITLALDVLFCTSSIIHLCTISLDRYLSISRPIQYSNHRTHRKIKGAITVVWLISAIISFPPLGVSLWVSSGDKEGDKKCELNDDVWYILYSSIGSFFAPCLIMILVYIRIYQIAKKHTQLPSGEPMKQQLDNNVQNCRDKAVGPTLTTNIVNQFQLTEKSQQKTNRSKRHKDKEDSSSSGSDGDVVRAHNANGTTSSMAPVHQISSQTQTHHNIIVTATGSQRASPNTKPAGTPNTRRKGMLIREKRLTFVLAIVIGVFVVCWFPFFFTYSLKAVCGETCKVPEPVFTTFFWIGYCNSAMNPVIYTIFNRDFRRAFRKILCKNYKNSSL